MFGKNKGLKPYKIMVIILLLGFFLPIFGYAINIFNYCNNRWSYALSFFIFVLIGLNSKTEKEEYSEETIKKSNFVLICFITTILVATIIWVAEFLGYGLHLLWAIPSALLVVVGVFFLIKKTKITSMFKKCYKQSILFGVATILTVTLCLGHYVIYSRQHNAEPVNSELYTNDEKYIAQKSKSEFFRADYEENRIWYDCFSNRPVNNGYMGTHSYNSISNKYVYEFLQENGVYNPPQNLGTYGLNGREALQSLLSVKYSVVKNGLVYGFNKIETVDDADYKLSNLYENENYNKFGVVYTKTISKQDYLSLPVIARQYALLQGIVVDGVKTTAFSSVEDFYDRFYKVIDSYQNVSLKSGVEFKFNDVYGKEVYLAVKNVAEVDSLSRVKFTCGNVEKEYSYVQKGDLMYNENRDFYINFGYMSSSEEISIKVDTIKGEGLTAEQVEIITIDTTITNNYLNELKNNAHLTDLKVTSNSIKGNVEFNGDGYLFLSIPYSSGWTAKVDGKKVDILQADTGFMAIKITEAKYWQEQAIELTYETPYLSTGKLISISFVIIAITFSVGYELVKNKKKKDN